MSAILRICMAVPPDGRRLAAKKKTASQRKEHRQGARHGKAGSVGRCISFPSVGGTAVSRRTLPALSHSHGGHRRQGSEMPSAYVVQSGAA